MNLSPEDSNSLIKNVADNLDNKNYKTNVDGRPYGLKNAKRFFCQKQAPKKLVKIKQDILTTVS